MPRPTRTPPEPLTVKPRREQRRRWDAGHHPLSGDPAIFVDGVIERTPTLDDYDREGSEMPGGWLGECAR